MLKVHQARMSRIGTKEWSRASSMGGAGLPHSGRACSLGSPSASSAGVILQQGPFLLLSSRWFWGGLGLLPQNFSPEGKGRGSMWGGYPRPTDLALWARAEAALGLQALLVLPERFHTRIPFTSTAGSR